MTIDQARRRQLFARWHRRIALTAFAWLAALAATGLLINHAHDWGLDRQPLPPSLQKGLYGIERASRPPCPAAVLPPSACESVFGRLAFPNGELLLSPGTLYLLDGQGRLVESLGASQIGLSRVERGLRDGGRVYIEGANRLVSSDFDLLAWAPPTPDAEQKLPAAGWQEAGSGAEAVSWERLLLDLHAARFLGAGAKTFTDLMAVLVLALSISGAWLWWLKRKRNGRRNGEYG